MSDCEVEANIWLQSLGTKFEPKMSSHHVGQDVGGRQRPWRRGHSRGRGSHAHPQTRDGQDVIVVPPPLGPKISSLALEDTTELIEWEHNKIENCQYLASYNLMEQLSKTILVPGAPPKWTPSSERISLQKDSGEYYRDINAAHFPKCPMEPVVGSIFAMNPEFDATEIDLVACGSTLGNLLRFASEKPHPFSFTVHLIGKTVFLLRRERSPDEKIDNIHGYGHHFLEACTTWDHNLIGSASHQRIIRYSFGDLDTVVRFEADGYTTHPHIVSQNETTAAPSLPTVEENGNPELNIGDLAVGPSEKAGEDETAAAVHSDEPLEIRRQGYSVPDSSIIDIKTRAAWKEREDIKEFELPRLWVRQIKNIVVALHDRGVFRPPEVLDIAESLEEWEQNSTKVLNRLASVLKHIRSTAMSTEGGVFEVRGTDSPRLQFHQLSKEHIEYSILPDDLKKQWEGVKSDHGSRRTEWYGWLLGPHKPSQQEELLAGETE